MSWEVSCTDMCRACMKVDGVLLPMYDDDTISRKNLPHKLAELTSIEINRFDGLPNMLCAKCAYRTDAFYEFKLQVQATERKLRKMFEAQCHGIKEEIENSECEQDSVNEFNDSAEIKLSPHKLTTSDINDLNNLEVIRISDENEQPLEIDVYQLIEEGAAMKKSDMQLKNIFLSKVEDVELINDGKSHVIKDQIPEEISKILQSQNLDYTIMYIPEEAINTIIETSSENLEAGKSEESITVTDKKNICISNSPTKLLALSENNEELLNRRCAPGQLPENNEYSEISEKRSSVMEVNTKEEESDGSDSDYFIDPKDNILGSLNDTITRVKEIKEGNKIQYQCTLCLQNYDKLTGVLLHTIDNHVPSSGPFFCVVCEKDCDSHRELRAHVKTHTGQFPYSCFICNKAYTMKRYLKRHMVCHTDFPRHRCPKCGDRFKVKADLEAHVSTHIHGAPYACSQCPRLFNHKGNYKRHLITHLDPQGLHLPKYPCKVCGKRFLNNRTLETHMRVHTGEKPFKCDVCGRSFSQQGNLLNHLRIHSNPRSYTCEVCGKRFNQRATLRDHSLLHTGEKPYVCNVCGIAFTFSAALRRHMWTHAGGKPFGCEICNARFVGKYDLRRHMRVHSNRPRIKRKKNVEKPNDCLQDEPKIETVMAMEEQDTETVLVEQVLLNQDVTQVVTQEESEKENVDALFNLIQYG